MNDSDWRLTNQARYLTGVSLRYRRYTPASPDDDHDHCEFCWNKFMVDGANETLGEGYATMDGSRWICKPCFDDFVSKFQWVVAD
jgi:hypothetical protein